MASLVASQAATTSSEPSTNALRQACRWILPLEVLGMLFERISRMESTGSSCLARYVAADGLDDVVHFARLVAVDLVDDDQPYLVVDFDAQGRTATGTDGRVALLDGQLEYRADSGSDHG